MSRNRRGRGGSGGRPEPTPGGEPEPTSAAGNESPGSGGSSGDAGGPRGGGRPSPRIGRRTDPASGTPGRTGSASTSRTSASGNGSPKPANRPRAGSLRSAGTRPPGGRGGTPSGRRTAERSAAGPARSESSDGRRQPVGIFGAFRAASPFPKIGETLGVALRAVLGSPVLVAGPMLLVLALWFVLLATGLDYVPQFLQLLLAIPPLSSFFDLNLTITVRGQGPSTFVFILAATAVRAAVWAVLVSLVVERLDTGRCSMSGVRRGLRSFPAVLGIAYASIALLFFAQVLGQLLGVSLGGLVFVAALLGGVFLLAFAPIVVVRDAVPARQALGQSARASRLPGSRHVGLVMLYFFVAFLAFSFVPGGALVLNASVQTWSLILAITVFHMVVLAALAYRYGVVEDDVPPPRPRPQRQPILGAGRRR